MDKEYEILYYDSNKDSAETLQITHNKSNDSSPQISNGRIVWLGHDGNDYEVYLYDTTVENPEQINISDNNYNDGAPQIDGDLVVWHGYDGTDNEIYSYNIKTKEKVQITDNNTNDTNPKVNNHQIVWLGKVGANSDLFLAIEQVLSITNVGDGESIRLKWSAYDLDNKNIQYRIMRKPETHADSPDEPEDWQQVNVDPIGQPTKEDETEVSYCDSPPDPEHPDVKNSGGKFPKRGVVYDYKIEVIDSKTNEVLTTLGESDSNNDGIMDTWKKGVAEPFIMLVRGYGTDESSYWNVFKKDLKEKRLFRDIIDTETPYKVTIDGIERTFPRPKTIWDTALLEHENDQTTRVYEGEEKRIGQIAANATGTALFNELKIWIKELKESTKREVDGKEVESPDFMPEHFYIYSHSMGAPNARYLEKLNDAYQKEWKTNGEKREDYIPYAYKDVMISPANCGSSLAWDLRSYATWNQNILPWLYSKWVAFAHVISDKKYYWNSSWFLQPNIVAKYNMEVKPSPNTLYYFEGGHDWLGGGFGAEGTGRTLLNTLRYFSAYHMLLVEEADLFGIGNAMKNDSSLTVQLQRGHFTEKVWNKLKNDYGFREEERTLCELQPNPLAEKKYGKKHFDIENTLPLNHYYGVMENKTMMETSWINLDIPPRLEGEPIFNPTDPELPFPPLPQESPVYNQVEAGLLMAQQEKTYDLSIPTQETWWITATWPGENARFEFKLINAEGMEINGKTGNLPPDVVYYEDNTGAIYILKNPQPGSWKSNIKAIQTGTNGDNYFINYISKCDLQMKPIFSNIEVPVGEPVNTGVIITENGNPVLNGSVIASFTKASDQTKTDLTLYDDGNHNDGSANDGIYGTTFNDTGSVENYFIGYNANVLTNGGHNVVLKADAGFEVMMKQIITIKDISEITPIGAPPYSGIGVNVVVNFQFHNPYIITAELYDTLGNHVAHGEGQVIGEAGTDVTATVYFDGNEISSSGINGPYIVKNFYVGKEETSDFGTNHELQAEINLNASDFKSDDSDNDGLPDWKETELGTDKTLPDTDNDGLTDYQEVQMGTDPLNPDTDGDTHLDGQDAFPLDSSEWSDRDGDGHGDNSDYFPDDPNQWENPNHAPVAVISGNLIYETTSTSGAEINLSAASSNDPDENDQIESYTWSGSFGTITGTTLVTTLPLGETEITLTVNDGELSSEPVKATIKVQDTTPPVLTVPEDKTIEATAVQTPVDIGSATATDIFPVIITRNPLITDFPLGSTDVSWTATDQNNNSVTGTQKITITDTTLPKIIISSPEARIYKDNEANPVLSFECSDIFGIAEQTAILNGTTVANGTAINLADLAGKGENTLNIKAKDANGNLSTAEVKFTVEKTTVVITPAEIIKFIDNAVREHKMKKGTALHLKAELYLYQYFMDRAEYFAKHKNPFLARLFKHQAEETLDRLIRFIKQHSCKIDPEIENILISYLQKLKNKN